MISELWFIFIFMELCFTFVLDCEFLLQISLIWLQIPEIFETENEFCLFLEWRFFPQMFFIVYSFFLCLRIEDVVVVERLCLPKVYIRFIVQNS